MTELDTRIQLFTRLNSVPHGKLDTILPLHMETYDADPTFYEKLVLWLAKNSEVKDHITAATIVLIVQGDEISRNTGLALMSGLNVIGVEKVVRGVQQHLYQNTGERVTIPRSLRTELKYYLRKLEHSGNWDYVCASNRQALKFLYVVSRAPRGEYVDRVLFDNMPDENTLLWAIKECANTTDITRRAQLVAQYNIPYLVASTFLPKDDPLAYLTVVQQMTPQQLANNLSTLEKMGLLEHPEIGPEIKSRMKRGKVNVGRAKTATTKVQNTDFVKEVQEAQIKRRYRITRPSAIVIDKSGSMHQSLRLAAQLAPEVATAVTDLENLHIYMFDQTVRQIPLGNGSLAHFEREIGRIRAGGGTAVLGPIRQMLAENVAPEQIIYLTDEEDTEFGLYNFPHHFASVMAEWERKFGFKPLIVSVYFGRPHSGLQASLQNGCATAGVEYKRIVYNNDQYAIDQTLRLMAGKSWTDTIQDILNLELPQRLTYTMPQLEPL